MGALIKPSGLIPAVREVLQAYGQDVQSVLESAVNETLDYGLAALRTAGTYGGTGKYRKSFAVDRQNAVAARRGVIYSKAPYYRLTHLLENGHKTRNGGFTRKFPHWGPVEKLVEDKFIQTLENGLKDI